MRTPTAEDARPMGSGGVPGNAAALMTAPHGRGPSGHANGADEAEDMRRGGDAPDADRTAERAAGPMSDRTADRTAAPASEAPGERDSGGDPDERAELVRRIRGAAAQMAQSQAQFVALLDRIDQEGAWEGWVGIRSFGHWVAFACEMTPHTAREYIRVARGLREFPEVTRLFGEGRVSYSKVREITRLAGRIDETEAARMCRVATSAQLSRMISTFRRIAPDAAGVVKELPGDVFRIEPLPAGRARITIELPEAEAAEVLALVDAAVDRTITAAHRRARGEGVGDGADEGVSGGAEGDEAEGGENAEDHAPEPISRVDRFLDLMRHGSRSGAEAGASSCRAEVHVHASIATVAGADPAAESAAGPVEASDVQSSEVRAAAANIDATAGAHRDTGDGPTGGAAGDEPRGVSEADVACIEGYGAVTAATVGRLSCGSPLVGALIDASGDVLALGRTKRLASYRQRRALAVRDIGCRFPGCARTRLLEAHHIRPWSEGGPTDLDNMLLLCRSHHIAIHEHGVAITRRADEVPDDGSHDDGSHDDDSHAADAHDGGVRSGRHPGVDFVFTAAGAELMPTWSETDDVGVFDTAWLSWDDYDRVANHPERICTLGGGEGFDLHECVRWIFDAARLHDDGLPRDEAGAAA